MKTGRGNALTATGLGEVTGAGSGLGVSNIDVEVNDLQAGLALVRRVLRELNVAPSTVIYLHEGDHCRGTGRVTAYPDLSAAVRYKPTPADRALPGHLDT